MSAELDPSRLTEEEVTRLMKMLNNKQLYKDPSSTTIDSISNCLCIQPFKTLSSYNYWIKKNLILISETDEIIYISGCNIIIENISTKVQEIISLSHKCHVTSLTYIKTTSNERILFVGEKLFPDENKITSGGVEIFHLENKNKKLALDLSAYVDYNCYVYDIIAGNNNETCVIILKNLNNKTDEVKLFFYNYTTFSLIDIEDIKYNLINISINPKNENQYLLYAQNYCALYNFNNSKMQLLLYHEFYNEDKNIENVEFITDENKEGIALSFKNEWIEIYLKNSEEEEQITGIKYNLFLKMDILSFFKSSSKKEAENLVLSDQDQEQEQDSENNPAFLDNLIQKENENFISPKLDLNKISIDPTENYPKFIICRKNYVLYFLQKCQIVIIFELFEEIGDPKIKIVNIELLSHKLNENCVIEINDDLTKMILINGESDEKYGLKQNGDILLGSGDKNSENNTFTLNEICINYFLYKIDYIDNVPNFEFESKLLENTALGFPCKFLVTSNSPRILLVNNGNENQDLFLYRQKISSTLSNYLKQKNFESSSQTHMQIKHDYYQENCSFEEFYHKKLDDKPLSICFNPQGKSFFISYKDCGYLYIILEREIKEVFKIAMYCRSCTFDETGTFLAFGTSEFDNEYNINILNLSCYEYEYMITKVPQPTKLLFVDGGRALIAQFNDNSTNLLGWSLNWEHRLIENYTLAQKDKLEKDEKNSQIILKISDFSGNIVDFGYDHSLGMCIITSHDKRERVYWAVKDEKHWEFNSDLEYSKLLIIKKYDSIIFGTTEGTLRACIWPIQNMLKDMMIDHPEYIETKVHNSRITSICVSEDLEFLYTSAEDGSIFVSSICAVSNDVPLELKNFYYFDLNNVLPKKIFFSADEIIYITDNIYQNKVDALKKKKSAIQGMISEFQSRKEKINQNNATDLENQRTKLTEMLDQKIKEVKDKENEKEKETKKLKDEREQQFKKLKEDLFDMKKKIQSVKRKKAK